MGSSIEGQLHTKYGSLSLEQLQRSFPTGVKPFPRIADLAAGNHDWIRSSGPYCGAHEPEVAMGTFGDHPVDSMFGNSQPGRIFHASHGGHHKSLAFSLGHLKNQEGKPPMRLVGIMSHESVLKHACRPSAGNTGQIDTRWRRDLLEINLDPEHARTSPASRLHAERSFAELAASSPEILHLMDCGELIGVMYEGRANGEVAHSSIFTSKRPGLGLGREIIQEITNGCCVHNLSELHPSLRVLGALAIGNASYVESRKHQADFPAATFVHSCSDARAAPDHYFSLAAGEIRQFRSAGNVIDKAMIKAIIMAVQQSFDAQKKAFGPDHSVHVNFVEVAHTGCGAITAAMKCHPEKSGNAAGSPIIDPLLRRFAPVIGEDDYRGRKFHRPAAQFNALAACIEISRSKKIQEWMAKGMFSLIPALYDLKTGVVEFDTPVSLDICKRFLR